MSNEEDQPSSVEQEAEEIVRQALSEMDLDGKDCPAGEDCAIHHRVDEELIIDEDEFGRLITYTDDYAVVSADNPNLITPAMLLKLALNRLEVADLPDLYETCVFYVGKGSLADLRKLDDTGRRESIRFLQTHSEWSNFKGAHAAIVSFVNGGLIDLSRPVFPEGK